MRKRKHLWALLAVGAAGLVAPSCDNTDIGVPGDPEGPLQVTRLTLLSTDDTTLRESQVFTDTLSPAVCETNADCDFTATRDTYGARLAPPNPDSAFQMRVVFNKIPAQVGGKELETPIFPALKDNPDGMDTTLPPTSIKLNFPNVAKLTSPGGCGTPNVSVQVSLTGTDKTPNPIDIPYGPALQLSLADAGDDPFVALEPGCQYAVALDPGLAGRDNNPVDQASAAKYTAFTTETFRVLQSGVGDDDKDAWEQTAPTKDDEPSKVPSIPPQTAFEIEATIKSDAVIRIKLNAPAHDLSVESLKPTVTVGGKAVDALATIYQIGTDAKNNPVCDAGNGRSIYIYPKSGSWGTDAADISVTLDGSKIFDVVQDGKYPKGKHNLGSTLTVKAKTDGKAAPDKGFTGILIKQVAQSTDAVCAPPPPADMAGNQG